MNKSLYTIKNKVGLTKPLKLSAACLTSTIMFSPICANAQTFEDRGFDFGAEYAVGYQAPPIGSDAGDSRKQRLTINVSTDLEKLFGLANGTFFAQYQNHNGVNGSTNINDIQQFDGLDDPEYDRIHMLWYQHIFMNGKLRIKLGKVEPKSEFFAPENATNHLGFSTERSPTIIAQGPPSMSFNAFYSPSEAITFAFGLYDATWNQGRDENNFKLHNIFEASDLAYFLEGRFKWKQGINGHPGSVKIGGWKLDGERIMFNGVQVNNTEGFYVVVDQTLTSNGVGFYAQFGTVDKKVSALSRHIGIGIKWDGPIEGREYDVLGAGVSTVKFSDDPNAPFISDSETAYELFYKAPLTSWLTVQADLQAITNPGGRGANNVIVSTFRATFSY